MKIILVSFYIFILFSNLAQAKTTTCKKSTDIILKSLSHNGLNQTDSNWTKSKFTTSDSNSEVPAFLISNHKVASSLFGSAGETITTVLAEDNIFRIIYTLDRKPEGRQLAYMAYRREYQFSVQGADCQLNKIITTQKKEENKKEESKNWLMTDCEKKLTESDYGDKISDKKMCQSSLILFQSEIKKTRIVQPQIKTSNQINK
jgi:hypothetical protein